MTVATMRQWLSERTPVSLFVGVVHLRATPGAPAFDGDLEGLLQRAEADARALVEGGVDALLVENFGDAPFFPERVPPETVASMARACERVRRAAPDHALGVNVLRNDARAALGMAAAAGADFVRVNVHVGAMLTDQGLIQGRAAETLRERARLCPGVAILADVHVKHASPLGRETIAEAAEETVGRGLADALIVSGSRTGQPPTLADLLAVGERARGAPVLVGSGLAPANAAELLRAAQGAIVGSALEVGGTASNPVDPARVRELARSFPRA